MQSHSPIWIVGLASELILGADSTHGMMMSFAVISFSLVSISSLASIGTMCLLFCISGTLGSSVMMILPGILIILSKECRTISLRSSAVDADMVL